MKFVAISKLLLILILPFLIFLLVVNYAGFDSSFYQKKFIEYGVENNVPKAALLHEKVINFITGKNNELPNEFNEREKQHLQDVKRVVRISAIALYSLIALFALLLMISAFKLKVDNRIINFIGKILAFGGFLTVVLAIALFFLINSNFSATFESFHLLFFEKGTYTFDPAKEMIVKLYPGQLFMDLGVRISKNVILASTIAVASGIFLIFKFKKQKNK